MKTEIAFFSSMPYDEVSFNETNKNFGFNIRYYKEHLNENNAILCKGAEVVCVFVNDEINRNVIINLAQNGTRLIALRCAGFNNIDLVAASEFGIKVVVVFIRK